MINVYVVLTPCVFIENEQVGFMDFAYLLGTNSILRNTSLGSSS